MEPKGSLPFLQEPSIGRYPEPDQSSLYHPVLPLSLISISILSTHLWLGLPSGLFPSGVPNNILHAFLLIPFHATCPSNLVLLDFVILIIPGEEYNEVPLYAVLSNLPSLHLSSFQIFYSASCDLIFLSILRWTMAYVSSVNNNVMSSTVATQRSR
jgi:hypothetical protein